jgi:hypothetical protein
MQPFTLRCLFFIVGFVGFGLVHADTKRVKIRRPASGTDSSATSGDDSDFVTEKRSDGTKVKYRKKTTYDFEGANIDGLYNKPSGSYISNIKDVKAKSVIRIRENFDTEVMDSSRSIK